MATLTAAALRLNPDLARLVVCDIETARKLEGETWTYNVGGGAGGFYSLSFPDGEIHRVEINGVELTEVTSNPMPTPGASQFYFSPTLHVLYLNTPDGDDPSTIVGGVYKYCIMAYFFIGIATDTVGLRRSRQMLLDGRLDLWTDSTHLKRWTAGTTGTAAVTREGTEVYDQWSAYSAKFTVGAAASQGYIRQDVVITPGAPGLIRFKYKCSGATQVKVKFIDSGNSHFMSSL